MGTINRREALAGTAVGAALAVFGGLATAHGNSLLSGRSELALPPTTQDIAGVPAAHQMGERAAVTSAAHTLSRLDNSSDGVLHAGKPRSDRTVWLTFDDGGSFTQVDSILRTLAATDVRGTFFPLGNWARSNPTLIRRMKAEGHLVGNHSYDHPQLSRLSTAAVIREITDAERYIVPNTSPKLFRCPYGDGAFSTRIRDILTARGYQDCYWTCDTQDWSGVSASTIVRRVLQGDSTTPRASERGVVLMHMSGRHTGEALPSVISGLRSRGLTLPPRTSRNGA